jgi:hypothetical protein
MHHFSEWEKKVSPIRIHEVRRVIRLGVANAQTLGSLLAFERRWSCRILH